MDPKMPAVPVCKLCSPLFYAWDDDVPLTRIAQQVESCDKLNEFRHIIYNVLFSPRPASKRSLLSGCDRSKWCCGYLFAGFLFCCLCFFVCFFLSLGSSRRDWQEWFSGTFIYVVSISLCVLCSFVCNLLSTHCMHHAIIAQSTRCLVLFMSEWNGNRTQTWHGVQLHCYPNKKEM